MPENVTEDKELKLHDYISCNLLEKKTFVGIYTLSDITLLAKSRPQYRDKEIESDGEFAFIMLPLVSWYSNRSPGRIQDFHLEGVQKVMCAQAHHEHEARYPLRPGSRARSRTPEALGVFDALSCYLSLIYQSFWNKMGG